MKLIIDIPEETFNEVREKENIDITTLNSSIRAIENGTPLDDVKAEIKSWYWQVEKQALAKDPCVVDAMVDLFIRTIDNIGKAESEDKG